MTTKANAFDARAPLKIAAGEFDVYRLEALERAGLGRMADLPYSIRVLLENTLRNVDGRAVLEDHVRALAAWSPTAGVAREIPFKPARVILQDSTGVPVLVDLAALRDALRRLGGDPARINPQIPAELVVDHSVQVDHWARPDALELNVKLEFRRNRERYEFLKWAQNAFDNLRVVPPGTGIIHQVNLEHLAKVVLRRDVNGTQVAMPDTLVGTDTHTTMINGLGVLGWGVGSMEAEAALLGQPLHVRIPEVVGVRLSGRLAEGATATDLALRVTELLCELGVVGKFVEFCGAGLSGMSLPERATLASMAPEYGATMGFFPVDDRTLDYLRLTGRSADEVDLVEGYYKDQGLFRTDQGPEPRYTQTVELDLSTIEPALAGPRRPQDRVALSQMKAAFNEALRGPLGQRGFALGEADLARTADVELDGRTCTLAHGAVVIAAIASCTNTVNPSVMLAAGLLARKAVERGLTVKPWVKTSLAPGSRVVTEYLDQAGLTPFLDQLGFHTVGFGCTTCIGNSSPLPKGVRSAVQQADLIAASVLSDSRNSEGRVSPHVRANYLASPPLVVAYAIAGTVDIDLTRDPLGQDAAGQAVYLKDIWPTAAEIHTAVEGAVSPEIFARRYADVFSGPPEWQRLQVGQDRVYEWDDAGPYIQEPPFFTALTAEPPGITPLRKARCLVMLGDTVSSDHISPAGVIDPNSSAGRFLQEQGVEPADFNSYGSRRGNDRVMVRGTFANPRIRNLLAPGTEGGLTLHLPTGNQMSIYDASVKYAEADTPLIVLAGRDYGTGSSRDWAAKGTLLLGIRAVFAGSFEPKHRRGLVGMGVLPLQFERGQTRESLGLTGRGFYDIVDLNDDIKPGQSLAVVVEDPETEKRIEFSVTCRLDTPIEIEHYRHGGVLPMVLRNMLEQ